MNSPSPPDYVSLHPGYLAAELNVTQSTVEAHRAKVMEKMGARSLSDLMRMVLGLEQL